MKRYDMTDIGGLEFWLKSHDNGNTTVFIDIEGDMAYAGQIQPVDEGFNVYAPNMAMVPDNATLVPRLEDALALIHIWEG